MINAKYVRVDHRKVQTSVRRFTHPAGRTVTVIGTFHIGGADYYRDLREVIDKLQANGAVVHCEGATVDMNTADASPEEREIVDQLRRAQELTVRRVRDIGWTDQVSGLGYPDTWQRIDLDTLETIRRLGSLLARHKAAGMLKMVDWPDTDRKAYQRFRLMVALLFRLAVSDKRVIKAADREPADEVIVTARTKVALDGVAAADRDVALVWGLAHLPGIDAGLIGLGFQETGSPVWHTVVRRRPSVLAALCRVAVTRSPHQSGRSEVSATCSEGPDNG